MGIIPFWEVNVENVTLQGSRDKKLKMSLDCRDVALCFKDNSVFTDCFLPLWQILC